MENEKYTKVYTYNQKQFMIDHPELWYEKNGYNYPKENCPKEIADYIREESIGSIRICIVASLYSEDIEETDQIKVYRKLFDNDAISKIATTEYEGMFTIEKNTKSSLYYTQKNAPDILKKYCECLNYLSKQEKIVKAKKEKYYLKKITKSGQIEKTNKNENDKVRQSFFDDNDKKYHLLSFGSQLIAFKSLELHLDKKEEINEELKNIIKKIKEQKEVVSLWDKRSLTVFPIRTINKSNTKYEIDYDNIDKYFNDILKLNDNIYKTKEMHASFGNLKNIDKKTLIKYLTNLIKESNLLEAIYFD